MTKILVIDDEQSIRNTIALALKPLGFEVLQAGSLKQGMALARESHPRLVILDLGLPDGSGIDVLKAIREWSDVPVIVLTVNDEEHTKVSLLENGADDYITKPFSTLELGARIRVALKHAQSEVSAPVFESDDLRIDLTTREVFKRDVLVRLTTTEYAILRMLVRNAGRVVPQKLLLGEIWGTVGIENPHYIRIYVGHLRKKIEDNPSTPIHVITEPGVGYRIK